jgi:hypothetical protein
MGDNERWTLNALRNDIPLPPGFDEEADEYSFGDVCNGTDSLPISHAGGCHIPYIHASRPDFGIQIWSGPTLRSASDPIYDKLPKFISCSFNIIAAYSFIR